MIMTVNCSERNIDVVVKEARGFYGHVIGGGSSEECSTVGDGRPEVHLQMSTDVARRERCSMVEHENAYVVAIEVRQFRHLEFKTDSYFIVRCPIKNPLRRTEQTERHDSVPVGKLFLKDENPHVGDKYDIKLEIPVAKEIGHNVQIGPCIAFVGGSDLKVLQLVDENGCPTAEEIPHGFQKSGNVFNSSQIEFTTNIKMFKFGDDGHFFLQCQLSKCAGNCTQE
ncbi:hypothetical protein L596_005901 [Steinernema carpocapsae]|uniref:ZP domain-containing protein n=1 Tax=Steinernema carpocapsae TaxID=34508 RepID=A0A4U8V0H1_STECR|nr:hypothetical protein L596_005901 [Steinernema carpocapsae]